MDRSDVTYENMNQRLVEVLPERQEAYEGLLEWWGDEEPGQHVVYGDLINPWLFDLLDEPIDEELFGRIFGLMEELANHEERHVREVVVVTILEYLLHDDAKHERARAYMGPTTLNYSRQVEKHWKTKPES